MEYSAMPSTDMPLEPAPSGSQLTEIIAALQGGRTFLLTAHSRPDGDAIGSIAGLARSLRKAGKSVDIILRDPPPENFRFLLQDEQMYTPENLPRAYDAIIVLDSSTLSFTGYQDFLSESSFLLIDIDHHSSNELYGDLNFLDRGACSTCEMVLHLIRQAGFPLDPEVAEPLFLGLMTDTRFFQNENMRASAYHTGGLLVETGLKTAEILSRLNRSRKLPELRLLGLGLSRFQLHQNGKMASLVLSSDDLAACGARLEHVWSCGLFSQPIALEGVIVGVTILQDPAGKVFCEFRSNSGFDVKEIAVSFGGGGHLAASGCNREGPLAEMSREVIDRVESSLTAWLKRSA
jgi:phosphoesterase RecJ-like protein